MLVLAWYDWLSAEQDPTAAWEVEIAQDSTAAKTEKITEDPTVA
jgi:hypothetical protein